MTTNHTTSAKKAQTPVEYDETTLELMRIAAASQLDFLHAPVNYEELKKPMNIVTARNGVFQVHKTPVATFVHCKTPFKPEDELVHLPEMKEDVILHADKIPFRYLVEILSFYRDVHKKDKTEAATLIFWNENDVELPTHYPDNPSKPIKGLTQDGKLIIYCPEQINTGGDTNFKDDTFVTWLRANTARYVELHSHHTMNAFWSPTDNANENATQFYFVWGRIFDDQPVYKFRYVNGKDRKIDIDADLVFDFPKVEVETQFREIKNTTAYDPDGIIGNLIATESDDIVNTTKETILFQGPYLDRPYPSDWMEQHSVPRGSFLKGQHGRQGARGDYLDDYWGEYYYGEEEYPGQYSRRPDLRREAAEGIARRVHEAQKHSFKKGGAGGKKPDSAQVALTNNLDDECITLIHDNEANFLIKDIASIEIHDQYGTEVIEPGLPLPDFTDTIDVSVLVLYLVAFLSHLHETEILEQAEYYQTVTNEEYEAIIETL